MGNTISSQDINKRNILINSILLLKFYKLDIGNRIGLTDYIDFIKPQELPRNIDVSSGVDFYSRKFFVIKASFIFENKNKFDTFSIFFQRYSDNKSLWHCCGYYGKYLMNTEGGASIKQFELIYNLLKDGIVYLNKEKCNVLHLNFFDSNSKLESESESKSKSKSKSESKSESESESKSESESESKSESESESELEFPLYVKLLNYPNL